MPWGGVGRRQQRTEQPHKWGQVAVQPPMWISRSCSVEEGGEKEGERREIFSSLSPTGEENIDEIHTSKRVT